MEFLKSYRKGCLYAVLVSVFLLICIVGTYPHCLRTIYNFFNGIFSEHAVGIFKCFKLVVLAIPAVFLFLRPFIFRYLKVLLDIKIQKQKTIIVKGLEKPRVDLFGHIGKNCGYLLWKTQDVNNKKHKFIFPDDINTLKGKTKKHFYRVTYYKYSKVITNVEKLGPLKEGWENQELLFTEQSDDNPPSVSPIDVQSPKEK